MNNKKNIALSEADVAYQILREQKQPLHYRELIMATLERMGLDTNISGTRLAQIHTEINLDSRFAFLGKGMWGLQLWAPKTEELVGLDGLNERSYEPKAADYIWDEDEDEDLDEDEDCLIPDEDEKDLVDDNDIDEDPEHDDEIDLDDLLDDELAELEEIEEEEEPEI